MLRSNLGKACANHALHESVSGAALRPDKMEEYMKTLFAAALVVGSLASFGSANAMNVAPMSSTAQADVIQVAGGCGPGFHPGPMGRCRPNRGPVVVVRPAAPIVVVRPGRGCGPRMAFRGGRCRY